MFDIGFTELLVIAVVALVVLGPERLPKAARFAGLWVRRARAQWYSVKDELERELAAEELKHNLQAARQALHDTEQSLHDAAEAAKQEFEQVRTELQADAPDAPVEAPDEAAPVPAADAAAEARDVGDANPPAEDDPQADLFGQPGPRR